MHASFTSFPVQLEFADGKVETDAAKIETRIQHAMQGYRQLRSLTVDFDKDSPVSSLSLSSHYNNHVISLL